MSELTAEGVGMNGLRRPTVVGLGVILGLGAIGVLIARAQPSPLPVRIALVSQWVVNQHRPGGFFRSSSAWSPAFRTALDGGVVDRVVFSWQRGVIQREVLVVKPLRVLGGEEAGALGGRGAFQLGTVRPPRAPSAWTEVEVIPQTGQAEDVAVLEVGWELNTIRQVLATLLVAPAGGELQELPLARRALIQGDGVPVYARPFSRPVSFKEPPPFRGVAGAEFLVVRSQVEAVPDAATTTNGPADRAVVNTPEWREGDRVFIRLSVATLRAGAPAIVLGWKDRVEKTDPDREDLILRPARP